ncbi:MAG TPA: tyrosine-type recombinase/integrase, partial [Steroidobacteraceae bacterium]
DVTKGKIQRNRQVAVLSAVYAKMVGRWYVAEKNPCRDVERNPSKKRTRYVTDAEYKAVHAIMPARVQIAMDLALLTGQRQGDLLRLHWKNATEDGVFFQQGKTGKRLLVGISPTLEEVLVRAKRMVPQLPREYILRKRNGHRYTSEGFRAIWQRGMRKAIKTGAIAERFTFHDLRAKSVSDSATIEAAFERAGHTSMAMTRGVYDRGIRKVTPLR